MTHANAATSRSLPRIEYKRIIEGRSTGRYYRIGKYGCFRAAICGNLKSVEAFSVKANGQLIRCAVFSREVQHSGIILKTRLPPTISSFLPIPLVSAYH